MSADHVRRLRDMATTPSTVQRMSVRYEDFVTDVSGHAHLLGDWLGVRLETGKALKITDGEQLHRTSGSVAESIGRWRRELSPELAARAWSILLRAIAARQVPASRFAPATSRFVRRMEPIRKQFD
jgi:hypothetical protein